MACQAPFLGSSLDWGGDTGAPRGPDMLAHGFTAGMALKGILGKPHIFTAQKGALRGRNMLCRVEFQLDT